MKVQGLHRAWQSPRYEAGPRTRLAATLAGALAVGLLVPAMGLLGEPGGVAAAAVVAKTSCPAANGAYAEAVLADHPVAYYRLGEASGPTMCDSSSAHNNGKYNSRGITYGVPGSLKNSTATAVSANGTPGVIGTGGPHSGLSGKGSFTLEGWFRSTGTPQDQDLVHMGQAGAGQIAGMSVWSSKASTSGGIVCGGPNKTLAPSDLALDTYTSSNCWNTAKVGVNLWDGSWHYLAVVYNGTATTATAYVDGRDLGTVKTTAGKLDLASSSIGVGTWVDTHVNQPFIGDVDEVAVYNSALTSADISHHYSESGR